MADTFSDTFEDDLYRCCATQRGSCLPRLGLVRSVAATGRHRPVQLENRRQGRGFQSRGDATAMSEAEEIPEALRKTCSRHPRARSLAKVRRTCDQRSSSGAPLQARVPLSPVGRQIIVPVLAP